MRNSCTTSSGILILKYTIQTAIRRSAAISVGLISSSASIVAKTVRSQTRSRQVLAMACTSVQGATQRDVLVVAGALWTPYNAGRCKYCLLIIIGLCGRFRVLVLTYLTRSEASKFCLSFQCSYSLKSSHRSRVWRDNATCVFEAGTTIQKWRAERSANKVRDLSYLCPDLYLRLCGRAQPNVTQRHGLIHHPMPSFCTAENVTKVAVWSTLLRVVSTHQKQSYSTKCRETKVHSTTFISPGESLSRQTRRRY